MAQAPELTARAVLIGDPRLAPLFAGLTAEYTQRYGDRNGSVAQELDRFPAHEFSDPLGRFVILEEAGRTVAGGALRRYDQHTAELKRIWTHEEHRRRGLARRVLIELERAATELGYTQIFLTTGPRQPEALKLYLNAGYQPQFDLAADLDGIGHLPFTKQLPAINGGATIGV
ncbi:GNAT family N-acetyltransferase [Glutamicibacter halophytocola]|uniref:GNAT family N-acetyltransferase n=1 Tax=Glutamicibacter halophytocola TaxID=1933880 RepID=A0ABX5Y7M0_9MICC|nr:GNAT family N-acetyltransferase [Glutamicibacter halophytocola]QDY66114.1 GNAT family N-acetyltransferase [Glutamicibacter halophytocola]